MSEAEPAAGILAPPRAAALAERVWRPVVDGFLAERERWPLWLPVLVGAGILVYFALPQEPSMGSAALGLALAVSLAALSRGTVAAPLGLALLACVLGFTAAKWRAERVAAPILAHKIGPLPVEGRVVTVTDRAGGGATLILDRLSIVRRYPMRVPERVKITMRAHKPAPGVGERIRVLAVLMPPPPPAAPGSFDFARSAYFARIGAVGYALGSPKTLLTPPTTGPASFSVGLTQLRHRISADIRARLPAPAGPVAATLLTGDESEVSGDTNSALRNAGLAHLLSISGLHMALVAGILFFGLRAGLALAGRVALRYPIKKWAAVAALAGTFLYLLLSGASYPAERSFLMTAVGLLALMVDRSPLSMRVLAIAALVLLLCTPEAVLSVSFQLSFAAVAALIALYEAVGRRWSPDRTRGIARRGAAWLLASMASGLACELALAPIAAFEFNRLSLFGAAANLVAIPLFGFWIMPAGVLALILMPLGAAGPALAVMGWGIDRLLDLAHWVAAWPGAVMPIPAMPTAAFAAIILGEIWILLWHRFWRWLGLAPILAGVLLAAMARPPDVLVEREGRLVAVRDADGHLVFSSIRRARFARELWMRRDGVLPDSVRPADLPRAECARDQCQFRTKPGGTVIYLPGGDSATAPCPEADLVVSSRPVGACAGAKSVIDATALQRGGAQAVWFTEAGPEIRTVAGMRGSRPWSRPRYRFRNSAETKRSSAPGP